MYRTWRFSKRIREVFGIFKAYCTRVGSGPFPTELNDKTGELMRKTGCEYGATTGRPRRCGWLDIPALRYAIMINGVTKLFMMKADVLSGFKNVRVCTSYTIEGKKQDEIVFDNQARIDPEYTELEGWNEDISEIREYKSLPATLRHYIEFIENQTGYLYTGFCRTGQECYNFQISRFYFLTYNQVSISTVSWNCSRRLSCY